MTYQEVIDQVNGFGPYQKRLCILLFISTFTCAIGTLTMIFTIYDPGHRCNIPELDDPSHPNYNHNISLYIPWDSKNRRLHQCKQFDYNGTGNGSSIDCQNGWKFNKTEYNTVVTEFELICGMGWKKPLTVSLFMMGEAIGSFIGGALSDRFGRKKVFLISKLAEFLIYFFIGMTQNYTSYVLLRWLEGVFVYLPYTTAFVLGNELMSHDKRNVLSLFVYGGYCTGAAAIPLLGWLITDWHWLMRVVGISGIIYIPYYWMIPESPFWLISTGRYSDAKKILTHIANYNNVKNFDAEGAISQYKAELKEAENKKKIEEDEVKVSETRAYWEMITKLLSNTTILIRIIVAYLSWIVTNMVYYGLALSVTSLNGNRFINALISGLLEFPGILVGYFGIQIFGRPLSLSTTMGFGGLCLASASFVETDFWVNFLVILGKTSLISAFYINFSITGEMAPTLFRNLAVGSCSAFGKVGSFVAPYLMYLGETTSRYIPYLVMGILALLSAFCSFVFLPETKGTILPGTIEEAAELKPYLQNKMLEKNQKDLTTPENVKFIQVTKA